MVGGTLAIANSQALGTGLLTILNSSTISYASGSIVANTAAIQGPSATFNVASGSATQAGGISESGGFVASIIKREPGPSYSAAPAPTRARPLCRAARSASEQRPRSAQMIWCLPAMAHSPLIPTRTLTNAIVIQPGVSATLSAAAQTTLTLDSSTGLFLGLGSSMIFGSATDTGTVVLAQNNVPVGIDGTFEVVGGTVRFGSAPVSSLADHAAVSKVDSGATLDLNSFSTH